MQIQISGHHLEVSPALHDYVNKKMHRLEEHIVGIQRIHVRLGTLTKIEHQAEATLHYAGHDLHASATDADMYAAIDKMADKIHRQAITVKEKLHGE